MGTIWEQIVKKKRAKYLTYKYLALFLVPRPGVEPGWMLLHWCLRPARLPIPPSGHFFKCDAKIALFSESANFSRTFFINLSIYNAF